ncbi:MAG: hypothetical protein ACI8PT_004933, partial [Gammaproteobacteria bacterium]
MRFKGHSGPNSLLDVDPFHAFTGTNM